MNAIHTALFDAVCALLLAETGGIGSQCVGELCLVVHAVNKAADHRVLARADQVEILALDFIHHRVHLGEAHHAGHDIGVNHVGRNHIGEAAIDHKVARVAQHRRVQSRNVAKQVVKAVARDLAGRL